ncbi:MAG TPA: radical SAM family heme chaperone HemW, partial [Bacteroidia bacterium]|nr:radical SAM family heme chaperone HemW [Bacteroidia bacterium]
MAGIYIHIPFCRQACHYCDFHFSVSLSSMKELVEAIKKEIVLRKNYLQGEDVETVYLGGGTPSILPHAALMDIFSELAKYFTISKDAEITLEANPDDLSFKKIQELVSTPVNRLSVGIQSFFDIDLKFLNRIHTAADAERCVHQLQEMGFTNITIDLIYGIQTLSNEQWGKNIDKAFQLKVNHISSYSLTVEPKTVFASMIQKKSIPNVDDVKSAEQFEMLMDSMLANGFLHYEISNFCKEGFYSKHNSSYWLGKSYLGLGPSAHSYNGVVRQWNVKSNSKYISSLKENIIPMENEILTEHQKYNEYILTSLRTMWGVDEKKIESHFSNEVYERYLKSV